MSSRISKVLIFHEFLNTFLSIEAIILYFGHVYENYKYAIDDCYSKENYLTVRKCRLNHERKLKYYVKRNILNDVGSFICLKRFIYSSNTMFSVLLYNFIFSHNYLVNQNTMIGFKVRMENKIWNFDRQ